MLVLCPAVIEERRLDVSVDCWGVCDLILLDDERPTRSGEGRLMLSQERDKLRLTLTSRGDDNKFFVAMEASAPQFRLQLNFFCTASLHIFREPRFPRN